MRHSDLDLFTVGKMAYIVEKTVRRTTPTWFHPTSNVVLFIHLKHDEQNEMHMASASHGFTSAVVHGNRTNRNELRQTCSMEAQLRLL